MKISATIFSVRFVRNTPFIGLCCAPSHSCLLSCVTSFTKVLKTTTRTNFQSHTLNKGSLFLLNNLSVLIFITTVFYVSYYPVLIFKKSVFNMFFKYPVLICSTIRISTTLQSFKNHSFSAMIPSLYASSNLLRL